MGNHHSVEDWDRSHPAITILDDTICVSEPTSLWFKTHENAAVYPLLLSRHADAQNVAEGRMVGYLYGVGAVATGGFTFRNQSALGTAIRDNGFEVHIHDEGWSLLKRVGGVLSWTKEADGTFPKNTWIQIRLSWWNGYTAAGLPALAVMMERYIAGEWVKQGDTLYDEDNEFKDSEINRCGPASRATSVNYAWIDDTEVWERTE